MAMATESAKVTVTATVMEMAMVMPSAKVMELASALEPDLLAAIQRRRRLCRRPHWRQPVLPCLRWE